MPQLKTVATIKWSSGCEDLMIHTWNLRCQAGCPLGDCRSRREQQAWPHPASWEPPGAWGSRQWPPPSQAGGKGELTLWPRESKRVGE